MKLYRGIKAAVFKHFSKKRATELKRTWSAILTLRSKGDRNFPKQLDSDITRAEKLIRLERQHFTDRKDIALNYAKDNGGALIEIDVPTSDIFKHFRLEFQNYGKRKTFFEIVYVVESKNLNKFQKKWKLRSRSLKRSAQNVH